MDRPDNPGPMRSSPDPRGRMSYKYIINAPPYHEDSGGSIALHRLCDLINQSGGEAYLYPLVPSFDLHLYNAAQIGLYTKAIYEAANISNYRINSDFKTPVLPPTENFVPGNDCIAVYPEVTFGNPLRARNVVRWLLHDPGHHTGKVYYGAREIYYRYADCFAVDFQFPGSEMADLLLRIQYTPFDLYLERPEERRQDRTGTAYCMRKGKDRSIVHDTADSILIDGKSHREIAAIFKSVKRFISYDTHTYFSYLAAIAGCESVVVPLENVTKEQWNPIAEDRYGLAYGFDDLEFALSTRQLALEYQRSLDRNSQRNVEGFMHDVEARLRSRSS
jgi:hypothetical protein